MVTFTCFFLETYLGYKVVALILLMTVSCTAMLLDILPVLAAAVLSAFIWNFFFIPPRYTFHIGSTEDVLMFIQYFVIALVNAVLMVNLRRAESRAREAADREKSIRLYNTLLNSLSHELRTPLSAILGAVDVLQANKGKLSDNQQAALMAEIEKGSLRLNRDVENLLNMSRLESGMLRIRQDWCDVNELIYLQLQKVAGETDHRITFVPRDDLPLFKLDAGLLEQIILNLVHNALRHTPPHARITIEATYDTDTCIIRVADDGPGFAEGEMEKAFDAFHRLPHGQAGGLGLGLSIVKGFAEAMDGQVSLTRPLAGGSLFTVSVPAETSFLTQLKHE